MKNWRKSTASVINSLKKLADGLFSAFSMFSILPVPRRPWNDENIRYILLFLPIVGLGAGAIQYGVYAILAPQGFNILLRAFLLMLTPFVYSGFLHVDGFCDTCDAWLSRKDLDARRKILKDVHMGVFAGCGMALLFLLHYICALSLLQKGGAMALLLFLPAIGRVVAALAVMNFSGISENGLGALFKKHCKSYDTYLILAVFVGLAFGCYFAAGLYGICFFGVTAGVSIMAAAFANNSFKGFSGDLAGFTIILGEAAGMVFLAL